MVTLDSRYRRCKVSPDDGTEPYHGKFRGWGTAIAQGRKGDGQPYFQITVAIVEDYDGRVRIAPPHTVKFIKQVFRTVDNGDGTFTTRISEE